VRHVYTDFRPLIETFTRDYQSRVLETPAPKSKKKSTTANKKNAKRMIGVKLTREGQLLSAHMSVDGNETPHATRGVYTLVDRRCLSLLTSSVCVVPPAVVVGLLSRQMEGLDAAISVVDRVCKSSLSAFIPPEESRLRGFNFNVRDTTTMQRVTRDWIRWSLTLLSIFFLLATVPSSVVGRFCVDQVRASIAGCAPLARTTRSSAPVALLTGSCCRTRTRDAAAAGSWSITLRRTRIGRAAISDGDR
jgi:hypothetical protein